MGLFKDIFGDNRVLTATDPDVQEMLTYMNNKYSAYIDEHRERRGNVYFLYCSKPKYSELLRHAGLYHPNSGFLDIPGLGYMFHSKSEAYEGLLWLYNYLEKQENYADMDSRIF